MSAGANPVADVTGLYDGVAQVISTAWGPDLHWGYWEDDDRSGVAEATDRLTDLMIEGLAPEPGQRILDIGCGIGSPAPRLARAHDVDVQGITLSTVQVDAATARAAEAGLSDRLRFRHADAMDMPFPGGRLAVAELIERGPVAADVREEVDRILAIYALHTLGTIEQYERWLADTGFVDVEIRDVSAHVARTGIEMARATQSVRDEFDALQDPAATEALIASMRKTAATPEVGYVFITAVRG
ncbi:class I SAM-dependent methyltransferase [Streptomyces sp. NPDC041068]|uniref:SAM-dependent methyltransferase n=1 Tax=Streptomyces sp. NPDC041068 TaxID=3155130 RepID=UPI0033CFC62B